MPITVTALDSSNNMGATYTGTVHFTSTDPTAILPADYTFTAADAGTHTFNVTHPHRRPPDDHRDRHGRDRRHAAPPTPC